MQYCRTITGVTIAVLPKCNDDALMLSCAEPLMSWHDGSWCYENGFKNLPTEPGIYSCTVEWWADEEEADLKIIEAIKLLDYPVSECID